MMRAPRALFAMLALLCAVPARAEKLRIAVFQLEPFMMETESGPGGVTVEYWRRFIAPRMGVEIEVLGPFPISRAVMMLENGEVDVVPQLTKIPDREARFLYPQSHLTLIKSCVIVRRDSSLVQVTSPSQFFGLRIGFMRDTYIPEFFVDARITIELIANQDYREVNLRKLLAGRIDAMLDINYESMIYYLAQNEMLGEVRVLQIPVEPVKVYSIFRKDERGRRLLAAFEKANREGLALGEFDRLAHEAVPR